MSEAKHNPGPWEAVKIKEGLFHIHYGRGERHNPVPLAILDHHRDGYEPVRTITTPANAHLIAAAPEMLEALKEFVRRVEAGKIRSRHTYAKFKEIIRKAEGKEADRE